LSVVLFNLTFWRTSSESFDEDELEDEIDDDFRDNGSLLVMAEEMVLADIGLEDFGTVPGGLVVAMGLSETSDDEDREPALAKTLVIGARRGAAVMIAATFSGDFSDP
jgi:hypothetical protein